MLLLAKKEKISRSLTLGMYFFIGYRPSRVQSRDSKAQSCISHQSSSMHFYVQWLMFVISFFFFWLLFFQVIKNVAKFKIEVRDFYDMANSQHFV